MALFAWFVFLVRPGLASWFSNDDLMNLHYYWWRGWPALLKGILRFWSTYYRPLGGLFYQSIYAIWGFHPLPFHIAAFLLLCADYVLLGIVVRQFTRSRWCALLALLLVGCNPAFFDAFFDTGTIYDILAFGFFWSAFALYVRIRERHQLPGWVALTGLLCLFVLALDAKEISFVFPVAIGLYELVWHPPEKWNRWALRHWIFHEGRFTAIAALLGIVCAFGKLHGAESLVRAEPYHPHYSVGNYIRSLAHYAGLLVNTPVTVSLMVTLLLLMAGVAVRSRRKCLLWGIAFILTGVVPLAFIPGRGGFAYMVPAVGWAVYVTGLLRWLLEHLIPRQMEARKVAAVLLFLVLFIGLAPWERKWTHTHSTGIHRVQYRSLGYTNEIHALIPKPRKGAKILLLTDAGGYDDYDVYFVIRLSYGDPALEVTRARVLADWHAKIDRSTYDYVLDWVKGRFVLVKG